MRVRPCQQQHPAATPTGKLLCREYRVKMSKLPYGRLTILLIPAALLAAYLVAALLARRFDLELPLWLKICWSVYILTILHVTTMGLLGTLWFKLPIERIAFGSGKRWLQISIAAIPVSFGILFFTGSVKFSDIESSLEPKLHGWQRSLVELSGCAVLLGLAAVIMRRRATFDVFTFWQQFIEGALSPFGQAQLLLKDLGRYLAGLDELSILAAMSFGMAAMNLLPLPPLNGGNAIMHLVSSTLSPLTLRDQEWLFRMGFLTFLFGCCAWLLALLFSWRMAAG
jgi:hypothetical protein